MPVCKGSSLSRVGEWQAEKLSSDAERIIQRYVLSAGKAFKHIALCAVTGISYF